MTSETLFEIPTRIDSISRLWIQRALDGWDPYAFEILDDTKGLWATSAVSSNSGEIANLIATRGEMRWRIVNLEPRVRRVNLTVNFDKNRLNYMPNDVCRPIDPTTFELENRIVDAHTPIRSCGVKERSVSFDVVAPGSVTVWSESTTRKRFASNFRVCFAHAATEMERSIAVVDAARYEPSARAADAVAGSSGMKRLDDIIQQFIQKVLVGLGAEQDGVAFASQGDSVHVCFEKASSAHQFCAALHEACANIDSKSEASFLTGFRAAIATGKVTAFTSQDGKIDFTGVPLITLSRINRSGSAGTTVIDSDTFQNLGTSERAAYGAPEQIANKHTGKLTIYKSK